MDNTQKRLYPAVILIGVALLAVIYYASVRTRSDYTFKKCYDGIIQSAAEEVKRDASYYQVVREACEMVTK